MVRVGTLVASPLNSLVTLADGPIQSLEDLDGATVGYSVGGFEDAPLGRMLATVGPRAPDLTLVNVNFALTPALLSGRVDAVIGAFRNFELTQIRLEGREGRAFLPEEHGRAVLRGADLHRPRGQGGRSRSRPLPRGRRGRDPVE